MKRFSELCSCINDQCDPATTGASVYVGLEHISSGAFFLSRHGSPTEVKSAKARFKKGDVLYGKLRPYLDKAVIAPTDGICSTDILVFRPMPDVCGAYLLGLIHSPEFLNHAVQTTNGVNHPRTSWTGLSAFSWNVPRENEQEKIAAVLWKIQRAIETEEQLIATARELKQSAMRQLFTRGLRGEPQKETEIGAVPESWRVGRLVEFAHFQRGHDITKKDQKHGTVPVLSSGGIKSWHDTAAAKGPGVVIGRKGSIGAVHYVEQDYWPHDTTLFATDFRGNVPLFVFYRLGILDLKRLDSGAANPALNRNFLHEELISWPNADEQRRIATILQTIDRKISVHERKRTTLQELFKTMLHQLMTGEIRVNDLDIDVTELKS
jgi:type I restriction enzyme S subunit